MTAEQELSQIKQALADPDAVWTNMLRGTIARPRALDHYEECKAELEKVTAERDAALKERDDAFATAKYFVEQNAIEVSKRGEAEHQVDLARGDLSEHIAKLECDAMAARVERDAALKACAEMRMVMSATLVAADRESACQTVDDLDELRDRLQHALSSDCGRGYVKAESLKCFKCDDGHTPLYCLNCAREGYHHDDEWKVVVEALRFTIQSSVENGPEAIAECIDRLEQALAHAAKLMSK